MDVVALTHLIIMEQRDLQSAPHPSPNSAQPQRSSDPVRSWITQNGSHEQKAGVSDAHHPERQEGQLLNYKSGQSPSVKAICSSENPVEPQVGHLTNDFTYDETTGNIEPSNIPAPSILAGCDTQYGFIPAEHSDQHGADERIGEFDPESISTVTLLWRDAVFETNENPVTEFEQTPDQSVATAYSSVATDESELEGSESPWHWQQTLQVSETSQGSSQASDVEALFGFAAPPILAFVGAQFGIAGIGTETLMHFDPGDLPADVELFGSRL